MKTEIYVCDGCGKRKKLGPLTKGHRNHYCDCNPNAPFCMIPMRFKALNDMTHTDESDNSEGRDTAGMGIKVPEGWVLVPIIPTPEMIEEAWAAALAENAREVWQEMIAAAPKLTL